jgi:gas vesicle protein
MCLRLSNKSVTCSGGSLRTAKKGKEVMNTDSQELQQTEQLEQSGHALSAFTGLVIGGLIGAVTMLLFAPKPGKETRAELQTGVLELRNRTAETVKDTITQVKTKANQIKADVQIKVQDLEHQGQDLLARQLDHVSHAAEAGKKAIQNSHNHVAV